jgi:hypothetical protein
MQGDKNELVTGRADIGCLMWHGRDFNFDGTAISISMKTKDFVLIPDRNVRFNYFWVMGSPQYGNTVTFRWYLNSRLTGSTSDSVTQSLSGEVKAIAAMNFSTQSRFMDRITPPILYSKGNSIAFEIEDATKEANCNIYSISMEFEPGDKVRNNLIGG